MFHFLWYKEKQNDMRIFCQYNETNVDKNYESSYWEKTWRFNNILVVKDLVYIEYSFMS